MAITITFSSTNGGSAIASPLSYGNSANGSNTTDQTIFIRHDGVNPITGCGIYVDIADTGTYAGDFTALADKLELISWGDGVSSPAFGGVQFNLNATGTFPTISWPTFANKNSADGFGFTAKTGTADSSSNLVTISTATGATSTGTIQAGGTPNVRFKARVGIPQNVTTTGSRQFKLKLVYNYTS